VLGAWSVDSGTHYIPNNAADDDDNDDDDDDDLSLYYTSCGLHHLEVSYKGKLID